MLFPDNILLANLVNINDESQLRFMLQVISIILCVMFFYNNANAHTEREKKRTFYGAGENSSAAPERFDSYNLTQNSPNPFSDETTIKYSLAERSKVLLEIYTHNAETLAVLVDELQDAGDYSISFSAELDGEKLPAGIYYYRLKIIDPANPKIPQFVDVKKMVIE